MWDRQVRQPHAALPHALFLGCPSPHLLQVWVSVSSLSHWLSDFHTIQFSVSSGCFLFLNLLLSFFWLCKVALCVYLLLLCLCHSLTFKQLTLSPFSRLLALHGLQSGSGDHKRRQRWKPFSHRAECDLGSERETWLPVGDLEKGFMSGWVSWRWIWMAEGERGRMQGEGRPQMQRSEACSPDFWCSWQARARRGWNRPGTVGCDFDRGVRLQARKLCSSPKAEGVEDVLAKNCDCATLPCPSGPPCYSTSPPTHTHTSRDHPH